MSSASVIIAAKLIPSKHHVPFAYAVIRVYISFVKFGNLDVEVLLRKRFLRAILAFCVPKPLLTHTGRLGLLDDNTY